MEFETGQDKVSNAPLPESKLIELIETCYVAVSASSSQNGGSLVDDFLKKALEQLVSHSSQFKYVISMTSLKGSPRNGDISMANAVGAAWNSKKDGFYNYTLTGGEEKYLVSVFWVSK